MKSFSEIVSIKEVARTAGLSPSTVSRVLNNTVPVSDDKKERVLEAVQKLGYRPNFYAKTLRKGVDDTIALIVPNISNPIYAMLTQGIESVAQDNGFSVVLCNTNEDQDIEMRHVQRLIDRNVAGFITAAAKVGQVGCATMLKGFSFPVIEVMRDDGNAISVTVDNENIGYTAMSKLLECGHRDIYLFSDGVDVSPFRDRLRGCYRALEEKGHGRDSIMEFFIRSVEASELADFAYEVFRKHGVPEAVFCTSDPKAVGIYGACERMGMKIPEDLSVIGVDDISVSAYLTPPLTTFRQPFFQMGQEAAKLLMHIIKDKESKQENIILPVKMIERSSVATRR